MPAPYAFDDKVAGQVIQPAHVNTLQDAVSVVSAVAGLATGRIMQVMPFLNSASLSNLGFISGPTVSGTGSAANDADGCFANYASGASSGDVGGLNSGNCCRRDWLPEFVVHLKTPATITSARFWAGLFSGAPTASATPAVHLAAFRYDTAADGTAFWRCATDDGGADPTLTTTTVALTADTAYRLRMALGLTDVRFWIDDVLVATHTTNLPTATTNLMWYATVTTLTTAARSIKFGRMAMAHK